MVAMHVPNPGIQTLWRFPCAFFHSLLLFTGGKERALCALACAAALELGC